MAYSKQNFQNGQILNAANLEAMENGIIAGQGAHNLLDNSDFTNPVNQRGKTSYSTNGNEYTIDRWKTQYGTGLTIENGYINIIGQWQIYQVFKNPKDGVYTFAAEIRINSIGDNQPNIYISNGTECLLDAPIGQWKTYILQYDLSSIESDTISFSLCARGGNNSNASISVKWAAMYKGSYDASTLPAYQPKGYAAELAECMRYFERIGSAESVMLGNTVYVGSGAKAFVFSIKYAPKRLKSPSVTFSDVSNYRVLFQDAVNASTYGASGITAIDDIMAENPYAKFRVSISSAIDTNSWATLQRQDGAQNAYIDISADL